MKIPGPSRHGKRRSRSSSPLPKGTDRPPGPLRQQSHSEDRRVRRPPGRRVVGSSGPPSCSRRSSQLWFVVKAKHKTGRQTAVDWAKVGKEPKTITAASYGRTVLRTSLRVAAQASVIDIWQFLYRPTLKVRNHSRGFFAGQSNQTNRLTPTNHLRSDHAVNDLATITLKAGVYPYASSPPAKRTSHYDISCGGRRVDGPVSEEAKHWHDSSIPERLYLKSKT